MSPSTVIDCWFVFLSFFLILTSVYLRIVGVEGLLLCLITINDTHTHTVGNLWTSDRPDAETYSRQHNTLNRHPCRRRDSNPQSQQASSRSLRTRSHRNRLHLLTQPKTLKTYGSSGVLSHSVNFWHWWR